MNDPMATAQAALAASRAARQIAADAPAPTAALVPVASGMTSLQIVQNTPALEKLGETFAASGFFGAVTKSTATAALINCFIEGLSPVEYKAKYHIMNDGSTSIKSDYAQRNFRRLGGRWHFNEWTAEVCDVTFTYEGEETRGRVTLDEFKQNGVAIGKSGQLKDNWRKFPREMLKARCLATYIRAICPEALEGQYTQEEAQDFDRAPAAPRVITPSAVSPSPVAPPPPTPAPAPKKRKASTPKAEPVDAEVVEPNAVPPTAKPAAPAPAPAAAPAPTADPEVCPCGKNKGRRFEELPNETLEIILANAPKFPAITEAHRAAIVAVLTEREEEG